MNFQIPQSVYVGDRAVLVLPLPEYKGADIEADAGILSSEELVLHRIAIENRQGHSRLVVEFTAYVTGNLYIPAFELAGMRFNTLQIEISSVLEEGAPAVLSEFAGPVLMHGTGFFIFSVIAIFVLLIISIIWFRIKGRFLFSKWFSEQKLLRLIKAMRKSEKRIRKALNSGTDKQFILDRISSELRLFLSLFTGINCRSMIPCEFEQMAENVFLAACAPVFPADFLIRFFVQCDKIRFSIEEINTADILNLLCEMRNFLDELYLIVSDRHSISADKKDRPCI